MSDKDTVLLSHGSGGTMMKRIIDEIFFEAFANDTLLQGDDAAICELGAKNEVASICDDEVAEGGGLDGADDLGEVGALSRAGRPGGADSAAGASKLAFSTDTFVVTPHFFPGGDIGRLAVCGTVNDVATSGAEPLYLSCAVVLEEGFPLDDLRRVCASMAEAAAEAGVQIVTGDTKVVNRGHGDGIYINTAGVGRMRPGRELSGANCKPGDKVLVSGTLGDHGIAIISQREGLAFETDIASDAAPLNHLIAACLEAAPSIRCFRDPTRGGLASTLNELAAQSAVTIVVEEGAVPVNPQVQGACDMLGYDVFQVANEGKMVCVVAAEQADAVLAAMRASRYGEHAAIIGEVTGCASVAPDLPKVQVRTAFGSLRVMDMLVGEQLPRIC